VSFANGGAADARTHRAAIATALFVIAVAAAFLVDGWSLKPGIFEPIGSGTVPNGVAVIVIALGLGVLWEAVRGLRREGDAAEAQGERWLRPAAAFAWTIVYAFGPSTGAVRYQWATLVYLPVTVLILAERPRKAVPWAAAIGIVLAFGLDYLFRRVLVTDLP
jgi:putative tricarboxylic transport membrane protein